MAGTSIIMSNKLFNEIIIKKHLFDKTVIDDIAIGVLINEHIKDVLYSNQLMDNYLFLERVSPLEKIPINSLSQLINNNIFFRNRLPDRKKDIDNIRLIINKLNKLSVVNIYDF